MKINVIEMNLNIYEKLMNFWKNGDELWLSDDDDYDNLKIYLERNPELNFVVIREGKIIATIKSSHDGRRGYIHHLAVKEEYRTKGIAKELVGICLKNLKKQGIKKVRVFVLDTNKSAIEFWKHIGFEEQIYDYRTLKMNIQ